RADIITPPGLSAGDQFRVVFVTSTTTDATSNFVSTYDTIVSSDAVAGGLGTYAGHPVSWDAIVSTASVSAISRLPADHVGIYLPDGQLVAAGGASLWNTLVTPLAHQINELSSGSTISTFTWTGTDPTGASFFPLGTGTAFPTLGDSNSINSTWVDGS